MKIGTTLEPEQDGTYVAEVYFGWKILERHAGEWWHTDRVSRWSATKPVQWVGPLPKLMMKRPEEAGPQAYDL